MPERLNGQVSKTLGVERLTRVRISLLPPRKKFSSKISTRLSRLNYVIIYYAMPMFFYTYILQTLKDSS